MALLPCTLWVAPKLGLHSSFFFLIVFYLVNFIQTPSTKFSLLWETASTCEPQLPLKFQTHYLSSFSLLSGHLYLGFLSTIKPGTFTEQPEQTQHSKGHHPKVHQPMTPEKCQSWKGG